MKADKSLIQGAGQLAQARLIGQQQRAKAIDSFSETFTNVYNLIQKQKNAEVTAEQKLYEDQRKRYEEYYESADDVEFNFDVLNADQVNQYRQYTTDKKRRYSQIFFELENRSLTPQQREELEFERVQILSDLSRSAADLKRATEQQNKVNDAFLNDEISYSTFYTNPGLMASIESGLMRTDFKLDQQSGKAQYNFNLNYKAKKRDEDFRKINENTRLDVSKYGQAASPFQDENDIIEKTNNLNSSLSDKEVLSLLFDKLTVNNGGYYNSILNKTPSLKADFEEQKNNLSNPNKRKEATEYFKDFVVSELVNGIQANIKAGLRIYESKNPDPKDDDKKEKLTGQALKNFNTRKGLKDLREIKVKIPSQINPMTGQKSDLVESELSFKDITGSNIEKIGKSNYDSYIYEVANTLSKILGSTQNNNVSYNTETEMFEIMGPSYGLGNYTLEQVLSEDDTDPNNLAYRFREMSTEE